MNYSNYFRLDEGDEESLLQENEDDPLLLHAQDYLVNSSETREKQ